MSEISLYRKYRPQRFFDLVGQEHIVKVLTNGVKTNNVSHAYLFCGPRGTGKTSCARILAKVLNCTDVKEGEPCLECNFCLDTQEGKLIDLLEIDAASNRGIDEIREIREKIKFLPTHGGKKIYIIDEVHMLTKEAFNALLKTLEEPPTHAHFILATTESHKVPETIISRCQRFDFRRINDTDIIKRLQFIAHEENIEAEEDALKLIAKNAQGGLRDAISFLEQMVDGGKITLDGVKDSLGYIGFKTVELFCEYLFKNETHKLLEIIDNAFKDGQDLVFFAKEAIEILRKKMLQKIKNNELTDISDIIEKINNLQEAVWGLKESLIPQLPLEIAVIKSCYKKDQKKIIENKEKIGSDELITKKSEINEGNNLKLSDSISMERVHKGIESSENQENVISLNEEQIKNNFTRILEHIKTPSIRRSFNESKLDKINGRDLIFVFGSNFHLEKVNNAKGKEEISNAFEEIFGKGIFIHLEYRELSFEAKNHWREDEKIQENMENKNKDLANSVLDIFGGEVI
ncbi:DNA polymerase III, subunit gamma and tau [Candidatus Peregrinibacteria bacterium RIFOXYA2_FULL_33_7]|nr:MAG: DNA polymerase III, subunit gamma and tau [Candidatus Peregrinibacteria bacterium RIFOXYA2_FULL_33_7]